MGLANETLAKFWQKSIVDFVRFGGPGETWPGYWIEGQVMNFGAPGQEKQEVSHAAGPDLLDKEKCKFWQSAPYYVPAEKESVDFVVKENYKEGLKRN